MPALRFPLGARGAVQNNIGVFYREAGLN